MLAREQNIYLVVVQKVLIMARFRRSMALRPVHRIKHVVDQSALVTAGAQLVLTLIASKDAPVLANTTEVETGSKVNGIYLRVEVGSNETDAGAITNVYMIIFKNPGGNVAMPTGNAVGASDNKRFVIHQEMLVLENKIGGNPRTLFNGVIVIPKGYRRFGPNDLLQIGLFSTALNFMECLQCHYKEFR